ncbi:MAG: hypothetical protein JJE48_05555 [Actinobacteria bacterium]|nr:hypothetical protein [Actinomycetota bacterium]
MRQRILNGVGRSFLLALSVFRLTSVAYIGAGTGSLIIQVVLASMLGAAVVTRIYWQRIKEFFSRNKEEDSAHGE